LSGGTSLKKHCIFLLFLFCILSAETLFSESPVNVLLLNSYHQGYLWTDEITQGIEDTFRKANLDLHIEYMDSKRHTEESYMDLLNQLLEKKHSMYNYNIVITSDNDAFNFYKKRGAEIFGDVPFVFCGLNYFREDQLEGLKNVTGINEEASIEENLNLIELIHKDCKRILVVADNTTTGVQIQSEINRIVSARDPDSPVLEMIYDVSKSELINRLNNLDRETIVFLTVFFRDRKGVFFEYDESVEFISSNSTVPVYGAWDFQLNNGIVGGYLVDGYSQGAEAADKALEILSGVDVRDVPVKQKTPVHLVFDYNQLQRFEIYANNLPKGSHIENRPLSFFSMYKEQLIIIFSVFIFLLMALVGVAYGYIQAKQAEKLILSNEENLRTTLYSIGDAVISTDLKACVVRMNPIAEVLTGWDNNSAKGRPVEEVFQIFHAVSGDVLENPVPQVLSTGKIVSLDRHTSLIACDGREFKISDSAAPIMDDSGTVTGVVLVFRNVSEEYRIQEELINERNYAKRIINNAPSLICGLNDKGITTFINPVIEKITGYREDEIIGVNFWKLFFPGDEFYQVENLLRDSLDGVVVDYEMLMTCKNGTKKTIVWNSFSRKNEEGEIIGYLGFGYDVTDEKKIKEVIEISKKRLRTIIDLVPSSIFVKDINGVFLAVNKSTSDFYGLDIYNMIGKNQKDLVLSLDRLEKMLQQDRQVIERGEPMEIAEEQYTDHKGNVLWQKTVKVPCPDNLFGEPAVLGIATDITKIKMAEKELFETNLELLEHKNHLEELVSERTLELQKSLDYLKETQNKLIESEKMAALGSLVAGVAHEINTPVGIGVTAASHLEESAMSFEELYKSGNILRTDFEKFLELSLLSSRMILSNMKRAADLIQSFKQVAVDQSSQEQRFFRIHEYIDEILMSLHSKFKHTAYTIEVICPEEFEINSYPGALSQIITNLVVNSLKHGFEDLDEGSITIDIRKSKKNALIVYEDTGKGISKENLEKIFDPFFTTKRGFGGSGLGMNIVYNLVTQSLNGSIKCNSIVGQGTLFEIKFPVEFR